jgi:uncharacterized protein YqhQ
MRPLFPDQSLRAVRNNDQVKQVMEFAFLLFGLACSAVLFYVAIEHANLWKKITSKAAFLMLGSIAVIASVWIFGILQSGQVVYLKFPGLMLALAVSIFYAVYSGKIE